MRCCKVMLTLQESYENILENMLVRRVPMSLCTVTRSL